ncbi:hypothetical protein E2C01_059519 [Portunus trituberculatus]|uniref:Uncharacterized protein n=1 Tax=Portunus trituberculatus TaxID=210409 RepID=A0A5B7H6X7_PORTR|nr:hypothetical protein [Portunus trituberculatus]
MLACCTCRAAGGCGTRGRRGGSERRAGAAPDGVPRVASSHWGGRPTTAEAPVAPPPGDTPPPQPPLSPGPPLGDQHSPGLKCEAAGGRGWGVKGQAMATHKVAEDTADLL